MTLISTTLPNDGDNANAASVDNPFNAIIAVINGQLDFNNLLDSGVTNAKLAGGITVDKFAASTNLGWVPLSAAPNTVTALGNRSYSMVFNSLDITSIVSKGMRLKLTRAVTAPTQCTNLNGTTQFFNKISPAGMTFTDDFVVSGWVKLNQYGAISVIASRYNGTSGWSLYAETTGQVTLVGYNASASNFSAVSSQQSLPINKWVYVAAQLDMSAFTATPTTSYVMIDGVDVPATVAQGGTNPTALIQAGNLEIGSRNGGAQFFPGKIAQVAIYGTKVTQATVLATMAQSLSGSEVGLVSAYSFNNSITDLVIGNANNLTAQASAVATNADSPFSGGSGGTTDYAIITGAAFSTNTTLTVQVPVGYSIPTTGGVSAASYSTVYGPYGFPTDRGLWRVNFISGKSTAITSNATFAIFPGWQFVVPTGAWAVGYSACYFTQTGTLVYFVMSPTNQTGLASTAADRRIMTIVSGINANTVAGQLNVADRSASLTGAATYAMYSLGATTSVQLDGNDGLAEMFAEFAYV